MDFNLNNSLKTSINWLFPRKCLTCDSTNLRDNHPCCPSCYSELPFQTLACQRCGQRFAANADYCGRCISHAPHFDACFCPFQYEGVIKQLIQEFKYYEKPELAAPIAQLMTEELLANDIPMPELIIPAPLHISRLRERGYNQSQLLALRLSSLLSIPMANTMEKHKATDPQVRLSMKKRQQNLKNCFHIKKQTNIKSVAIIDDVITTGATANEIAKTLKKNGVDCIQVWAIAHTI